MSKKIFLIFFSILFAVTVTQEVEAAEKQYISINDKLINFGEPELIREGNVLYAPLEKVTGMLGGKASSSANKQEVTIFIGKNKLYFNKKTGVSKRNDIRLYAKEIRLFKQITYVSLPYLATINGFHFEKIKGYPLTRINTSNKKLSLDAYMKKMKPHLIKMNKPTVYLTFDDGPNKYTKQNLATLKKYKAKATFFFIGNQLNSQQNTVKQAAKEGHYIGLHSMTHDKRKDPVDWKYSQQAYKQIIKNTQNGIKNAEEKKISIL